MKKTTLVILLVLALAMALLGCQPAATTGQSTAATTAGSTAATSAGETTASAETTAATTAELEQVTLYTYFIGDKPLDCDMVMEEVNRTLTEKAKATLDLQFLSWSDFSTKYTLVLASGDNLDIIYTADWCFYNQEARKGAFYEITDDFLTQYMPLTKADQLPESWEQAKVDGKIFCIPNNNLDVTNGWILGVRDDLRQKYNLPEIKTIDDLEAYYFAIAENETGIFGYDAAIPQVSWLRSTIFDGVKTILDVNANSPVHQVIYWTPGQEITMDNIGWYYDQPDFVAYAKRMQSWANKGVWSKNALSNQIVVSDSWENGKSASAAWNGSLYAYGKRMVEKNEGWDVEYIDMQPNSPRFAIRFTNDSIAIAAASKNPERSGMVIDLLKHDDMLNMTIIAGIEGKHWKIVDAEKRTYEPGEAIDNFGFLAFAWPFKTSNMWENSATPAERITMNDNMKANYQPHPFDGFSFDPSEVEAELAAYTALVSEYDPMLDFGLVEDVDATIAEFKAKAEAAGYNKVVEAVKAQLQVYLDAKK